MRDTDWSSHCVLRVWSAVLLSATLTAAVACNGKSDDHGNTDSGTTSTGPLKFTFKDSIPAVDYDAEVAQQAILAHEVSTLVLSSAALVSSDEKVQDRLNVDGGGGYSLRAASLDCWDWPEFPMFSFAIDYSPCSVYQIGGGVFVEDHPSGPLLYEFQDFTIKNRKLGGVLALDTRGAFDDESTQPYWVAYNTDSYNPGLKNPVQLGATIDGVNYGVSYSGGASVNLGDQKWSMWGTLTIGFDAYTTATVVHGGVVPADVPPDEPSGTDVDTSSLDWLSCRCPTSGIESQDLPLHFTKVTLDIDDLEDVPDEVDDPSLDIDVDYDVAGSAVLTHTGCGKYDVDYTSDPVEIQIPANQLIGAISFQCATLAIDDEVRCAALLNAASALPNGVTVTVDADQANQTAHDAVNTDFDTTWCQVQ